MLPTVLEMDWMTGLGAMLTRHDTWPIALGMLLRTGPVILLTVPAACKIIRVVVPARSLNLRLPKPAD